MDDHPVLIIFFAAITVGAPLLRTIDGGTPQLRARYPVVVAYYGLLAAHEAAGRFGNNVRGPMMLLVLAGVVLGLVLLVLPQPRPRDGPRGFEVNVTEASKGEDPGPEDIQN